LQWHIRAQFLLHGLGAVATSGFVGRCGDRWSLWTVPAVASSLSDALAANHTHCEARCSEINGPPGAGGQWAGRQLRRVMQGQQPSSCKHSQGQRRDCPCVPMLRS
jgi:hypothetical protein